MKPTLDALARPSGTFLMVAMDQRDSLRTMLAQHHEDADEARMVRFKLAVARELGPYASGFLIDRHYAYDDIVREHLLPPTCGLILAADALDATAAAGSSKTPTSTSTSTLRRRCATVSSH